MAKGILSVLDEIIEERTLRINKLMDITESLLNDIHEQIEELKYFKKRRL